MQKGAGHRCCNLFMTGPIDWDMLVCLIRINIYAFNKSYAMSFDEDWTSPLSRMLLFSCDVRDMTAQSLIKLVEPNKLKQPAF